jgi:hypothetical protein
MTNLELRDINLLIDQLSAETIRYSAMRRQGASSEALAASRQLMKAMQAEIQRRKDLSPTAGDPPHLSPVQPVN